MDVISRDSTARVGEKKFVGNSCVRKQAVVGIDGDGYTSDVDCDDNNSDINPGQEEEPYNGIDDDCDPETLDDDLDQDGFALADDCDDNNSCEVSS